MKFKIYSEDFKRGFERILTIVEKKSKFPNLRMITLETMQDGKIAFTGFSFVNGQRSFRVFEDAEIKEGGKIFLTVEQCKTIERVKDMISFNTEKMNENQASLTVTNGKKKISMCVDIREEEYMEFPTIPEEMERIGSFNAEWYLRKCSNIVNFSGSEDNNMMNCIHYQEIGNEFRLECIDGHRVARVTSGNLANGCEIESNGKSVLLSVDFLKSLKKLVNKKTDTYFSLWQYMTISEDGNKKKETMWNLYCNEEFQYIEKQMEAMHDKDGNVIHGKWFDIERMMQNNGINFHFKASTETALEIFKNAMDDVKAENTFSRIPVFFFEKYGKIYTTYRTMEFISTDVLVNDAPDSGLEKATGNIIAINPFYLLDVFKIAKKEFTEDVRVEGVGAKSPIYFTFKDYKIMILPVNVNPNNDRSAAKGGWVEKEIEVA